MPPFVYPGPISTRIVTLTPLLLSIVLTGCNDPEPAPPPVAPRVKSTPVRQPPAVVFNDITEPAGIDFVHTNGATG